MSAEYAVPMLPRDGYNHLRTTIHGLVLSQLVPNNGIRNHTIQRSVADFMMLENARAALLYKSPDVWPTDVLGPRPSNSLKFGSALVGMASLGAENAEIAPCWLCPQCPVCITQRRARKAAKEAAAGHAASEHDGHDKDGEAATTESALCNFGGAVLRPSIPV